MDRQKTLTALSACRKLLVTAALLVSACATPVKYLPLVLTQTPDVVVHPFSTKLAGEEYDKSSDFAQTFAEYLAGALQADGIQAQVFPVDHDSRGARFVVDGDITQIHCGIPPPHFWSMFGTDNAVIAARYRMSDAENPDAAYAGKTEGVTSGGDSREKMLRKSAISAAGDLADAIEHDLRSAKNNRK
ncbi:MAG: hypothetical protein ACRESS_02785 [Stenotrophobium sp.]